MSLTFQRVVAYIIISSPPPNLLAVRKVERIASEICCPPKEMLLFISIVQFLTNYDVKIESSREI